MPLLRSTTTTSTDTGDLWQQDETGEGADQLFFVTSYSDFDKLGTFFPIM